MDYVIDKKTSDQITILKGLLMVLVVFIHSYREEVTFLEKNIVMITPEWFERVRYFVSQVLARAAVPAFFILSSVLLYRKEFTWKENMKKKIKSILIPYFLMNGFWIFFFYVAQYIDFTIPYLTGPQSRIEKWGLIGWLDAFFGNFVDDYPALYPMWFMRDLFLLNVFAVLVKKCVDKVPLFVLAVISAIWLFPIPLPYIGGMELSGQGIVFFILGYYVVKYRIQISEMCRMKGRWLIVAYLICAGMTAYMRNSEYHYTMLHITILAGILLLFKISWYMERSRRKPFYMWFASYSFSIFAFHEMGLTILTKLLARVVRQTTFVQVAEYFGLPLIIIVCCILFGSMMKRWLPGVYRLLTGNR